MPIYEYQCEKCGSIEEAIQKVSDEPLSICNRCNGILHRLVSRSSFHLKGSGWYVTDYANRSSKNLTGGDQKPDSVKKDSSSSTQDASKSNASAD